MSKSEKKRLDAFDKKWEKVCGELFMVRKWVNKATTEKFEGNMLHIAEKCKKENTPIRNWTWEGFETDSTHAWNLLLEQFK